MTNIGVPAGVAPGAASWPGLSTAEAGERLARDGANVVVPESRAGRLRRVLGPLLDPMVLLLLVAAPTYAVIGETTDAVVALVALVPVVGVGWALEVRAERTLDRLARLTAPGATVVRDGVECSIPASDVVVGDVMRVREGDVVAADALVVWTTQVQLDESALTGESWPVSKGQAEAVDGRPGAVRAAAGQPIEDVTVWAGTTVVSGEALTLVTATGTTTRYGQIGRLVAGAPNPLTPLQRALARLVRALALVALVFCAAVVAAELLHGHGWGEAVIAGVSLAIAAIPEEFSMVYALYLALGAWRLVQDEALVRRLPSVETLGSTTVICVDKTGTLTEGRPVAARLWTPSDGVEHTEGDVSAAARRLLEVAVRACEPVPFDPLDVAIVEAAQRAGAEAVADVDRRRHGEFVRDWPFDPVDKYVTHVWSVAADRTLVAAKGSIEGILRHCADGDDARSALAVNAEMTGAAMRVIAVASGPTREVSTGTEVTRADDESDLRLVGLLAFVDPVRPGVVEAMADCRDAGVRVVMMTGDHPSTARSVALQLGITRLVEHDEAIVTGDDLDAADADGVDALASSADVFARIRPDQKNLIVESLRSAGEVVAMTGDGINDAPALRTSDIGIAMGRRGTDVARSAASIVLLDDDFTTIVRAVRDGRRIVDNLVAAFSYLIAFHPPLLLSALVFPILGQPLLLLPIHFVVLELILHPVVSLVFQADPARPDTMSRPPRRTSDVFALSAFGRSYAVGSVLALAVVAVHLGALGRWTEDEARALAFVALLGAQPSLLLGARSPDRPVWRGPRPTRTLVAVLVAIVSMLPAIVYVPGLASLLHLAAFPPVGWVVVVAVALVPIVLEPLADRHAVRRSGAGDPAVRAWR